MHTHRYAYIHEINHPAQADLCRRPLRSKQIMLACYIHTYIYTYIVTYIRTGIHTCTKSIV